jgi:hypothetical protein
LILRACDRRPDELLEVGRGFTVIVPCENDLKSGFRSAKEQQFDGASRTVCELAGDETSGSTLKLPAFQARVQLYP